MYGAIVVQKWASGNDIRKWLGGKAAEGILGEFAAMHLPEIKASEEADADEPHYYHKAARTCSLSQAMDAILTIRYKAASHWEH
ncbi:hypothetical protein BOTBODRAFT_31232 [Botryobasidium botryosum FD-172 SS1]|uniref:Uncharacterized protein n=1 Tax=Botryobasidium botryosum (strain FD-172 SS1) TaxID=930990 RepID=A0A067MKS3_BOTB1|nr:hypothetical protein BOTBODRAFT_31232 [Botryobasidium botryosum FD-172 SS1]